MATIKTLVNAIHDALVADATLSAYIKQYHLGTLNTVKPMFPFVATSISNTVITPVTTGARGQDDRTHTFLIDVGTKSVATDTAFNGDGASTKGIMEVVTDVLEVLRVNDFSQGFYKPVDITNIDYDAGEDRGSHVYVARITVVGTTRVARNA